jgi:hypothetical protein
MLQSHLRVRKGKRFVWRRIGFRVKGREVIWGLRNMKRGQTRVIRVRMAALHNTKGRRTNRVVVGGANVSPPRRAKARIAVRAASTSVLPAVTG